jgi:hypothetical protein
MAWEAEMEVLEDIRKLVETCVLLKYLKAKNLRLLALLVYFWFR